MKNLVLLFVLIGLNTIATAQKTFIKTYGGAEDDANMQLAYTPDGKILTVGFEKNMDNVTNFYGRKIYLNWFDTDGNHTSTRALGLTVEEKGYDVSITSDGGMLICSEGKYIVNANCGTDAYFIRTDPQGNKTWAKGLGGLLWDDIQCAQELPGGDIIALGNTASYGSGNFDAWIGKFKANGDTVWTKTYGSTVSNVTSAQETARKLTYLNGSIYACGTMYKESDGKFYPWIFKTDGNGNLLWSKLINTGATVSSAFDIVASGNTLIAFTTDRICKVDTNGNLISLKALPAGFITQYGNPYWAGMAIAQDGGILISGNVSSEAAILKTDTSLNTIWIQKYPDDFYSAGFGTSIIELPDGRIAMAGIVYDGIATNCRLWVAEPNGEIGTCFQSVTVTAGLSTGTLEDALTTVKNEGFLMNGNATANTWTIPATEFTLIDSCVNTYNPAPTSNSETIESITAIYPNPVSHYFTVQGNFSEINQILLIGFDGKQYLMNNFNYTSNEILVYTNNMAKGIYLIQVDGKSMGKIIKN